MKKRKYTFDYSVFFEFELMLLESGLMSKADLQERKLIREYAIKQFEEDHDVFALFTLLMSHDAEIPFVGFNKEKLIEAGIFEAALFNASIDATTNNLKVPVETMNSLFNSANREKLRAQGDSLPEEQETYTVYRGIAGTGELRRKYGYSWTGSINRAIWFAKRFKLEDPAVYKANVSKENIYFYTNCRNEDEYVCHVPEDTELTKVWPAGVGDQLFRIIGTIGNSFK
jgi:hypothetical protein